MQFDIVHEQALHAWITKTTLGRMQVSYDQMLRIRDQIQNYPDNFQWKMDLGRHWEIQRNGDTLEVVKGKERVQTSSSRALPGILFAGPASDMNGFNSKDIFDGQETVELCFGQGSQLRQNTPRPPCTWTTPAGTHLSSATSLPMARKQLKEKGYLSN